MPTTLNTLNGELSGPYRDVILQAAKWLRPLPSAIEEQRSKIAQLIPGPATTKASAAATTPLPAVTAGAFVKIRVPHGLQFREVPEVSQWNIRVALGRFGVTAKLDEFANRVYLSYKGRCEQLTDVDERRIWLLLEEKFELQVPQGYFRQVLLNEAALSHYHPVRDYLDSLTWDGTPRLDTWLVIHAGATDSAYVRAVSSITLIAAVRRIRIPGCKFDEMTVLESEQGKNKSSALEALCRERDWFTDGLRLSASAKEVIEQTEGKWIVEVADLSGISGAEVESLKAMLSRGTDSARAAYGHHRADRPRQFVLFGTTNDSEYLRDMTGNRRFWPVSVRQFDLAGLTADRDQLWAEAAAREASGESIRLPEHLWADAAVEQDSRRVTDPWEDTLSDALYGTPTNIHTLRGKTRVTRLQLLTVLGKEPSRVSKPDGMRLCQVMTRLGWKKMTVTGSTGRAEFGYGLKP